ncbi:uncharacterized protein [Miscanthus floridulus]
MQIKGGFPKNYLTRFRQQFHVAFHTLDLRLTPAVYIDSFALNFLPSVFALLYSFIAGSIPRIKLTARLERSAQDSTISALKLGGSPASSSEPFRLAHLPHLHDKLEVHGFFHSADITLRLMLSTFDLLPFFHVGWLLQTQEHRDRFAGSLGELKFPYKSMALVHVSCTCNYQLKKVPHLPSLISGNWLCCCKPAAIKSYHLFLMSIYILHGLNLPCEYRVDDIEMA